MIGANMFTPRGFPSLSAASMFVAFCLAFTGCWVRQAITPLDQAELAIATGRYGDALPFLQQEVRKAPGDAELVQWLGLAYWKVGQPDKAAECFETAQRLLPADPRPAEYLGRIEAQRKRWLQAESALARSLRAAPKNPRAWTALAMVKLGTNNIDSAQSYLKEAIRLQTNYAPALYDLAWVSYYRRQNNAEASALYRKYLAVSEDRTREARARSILKKIEEVQPPSRRQPVRTTNRKQTVPR